MTVENVIADRAYSGKDNLKLANQEDENGKKNFKLISRLNQSITEEFRKDNNGFVYNKDADMMQCPVGELAVRKAVTRKVQRTVNSKTY